MFLAKAKNRRVEMRRIKYIYMQDARIAYTVGPAQTIKDVPHHPDYNLEFYSSWEPRPDFLSNPHHYLSFTNYMKTVDRSLLEDLSDSEQ